MEPTRPRCWNNRPHRLLLTLVAALAPACGTQEPVLSFLDEQSSLSFAHPPRWSVGFAEQNGLRYRYVTAPKAPGDTEALSVTLIAPTAASSAEAAAQPYLLGASNVIASPGTANSIEWSFKDSSGVLSRLRLAPSGGAHFFGAWVRGSGAAMKEYGPRIDGLLASLRVEKASEWPQEKFAGMVAHAPPSWTRGSRFSSATNASMQFKSTPLAVEKSTSTIHGFVALSKEPVPGSRDLDTFNGIVKARASDTVVLLEHRPWAVVAGVDRPAGYVDLLRSGTTLTATRIRRWITVRNGVGLVLSCESRADAFERLDPWCIRMAETVRLDPE